VRLTRFLGLPAWSQVIRVISSICIVGAILVGALQVPRINDASVALVLVLAVVLLATAWGSAEAMVAAIAGGFGLDYFFLPPRGFSIEAPDHILAMLVFLTTAIVTGQLAARSQQRRIFAERRQQEIDKLYQLVSALLDSEDAEANMPDLVAKVMAIFHADGVALYTKGREIVRAGPQSGAISDQALQQAAAFGERVMDPGRKIFVVPIRHGRELAASIGIAGAALSQTMVDAIAGRIGLGLARLYAIERITEAEVARRSEELKSAVLDALAHEIRSPLNSVKIAATTLLSARGAPDVNRREMLSIIDEEVDRMDNFIDEAVQLTRMEANELSLHREPQDLTRLLSGAIEQMGASIAQREVQLNVPPSLPPAECDRRMVLQVLKQLLNNALKYSPAGSPLELSAECTGSEVVIEVRDRGPGVAEDEHERIFEKYYRGRAARGRSRGTGLGLASARCIVQAHGGRIWVTNAAGGGAAFHVSLPVAAASRPVGTV